jgi:hypothetical protein
MVMRASGLRGHSCTARSDRKHRAIQHRSVHRWKRDDDNTDANGQWQHDREQRHTNQKPRRHLGDNREKEILSSGAGLAGIFGDYLAWSRRAEEICIDEKMYLNTALRI